MRRNLDHGDELRDILSKKTLPAKIVQLDVDIGAHSRKRFYKNV
jgi:hypothetical protein